MKEIKLPNNLTILALDIEPNAGELAIKETSKDKPNQLYYHVNLFGLYVTNQRLHILPQGDWQLLGKFRELSEKTISQFIESEVSVLDWKANTDLPTVKEIQSKDVLASLIRSQGIEPNDNTVILIKKS